MEEKMNLDEILENIMQGKMSIRKASEKFGYGRDFLKNHLVKKYGNTPENLKKIDELMNDNKVNSTTKEIDESSMETVFIKTMSGEITLEEAREELHGIDIETLKNKFFEYAKSNPNPEMLERYKKHQESLKPEVDVSGMNFRLIAIKMMRARHSQSDVARELGISPRTVSREFEKFSKDKDSSLYDLIKFYSDKVMRKKELSKSEAFLLSVAIDSYEKNHPELLEEKKESKEELKRKKAKFLVIAEEKLKKQGLTQEEIAKKLKTSISGLRRARIFCEQHNLLEDDEKKESSEESKKTETNKTGKVNSNDDGR